MQNKRLYLGLAVLVFLMVLGCRFGSRFGGNNSSNTPQVVPATSAPVQAPADTQAAPATTLPIDVSVTPPATLAGSSSSAQSDQIANQLKSMLDQLNTSLAGVNTLQDTPPGP
ncbi:MAG TPA: hypothetical protein VMT91_15695 [Anaerolineales bacterium]|nr:hypothetical protein [Anaerolineales bacterium]